MKSAMRVIEKRYADIKSKKIARKNRSLEEIAKKPY